jgi:hypothetical protein
MAHSLCCQSQLNAIDKILIKVNVYVSGVSPANMKAPSLRRYAPTGLLMKEDPM